MLDIRSKQIINNLLYEICSKTELPQEQYEMWLKTEIGITDKELNELAESDCLPQPNMFEIERD